MEEGSAAFLDNFFEHFFEQWTEEFARAVEISTGERPALSQKPVEAGELAEWEAKRGQLHWWQQETAAPQKFKAWIGAAEACWTILGGEEGSRQKLFQEMLSQANQEVAAVLSSALAAPLRFNDGLENPPPALAALRLAAVSLTFREAALPAMLIALEPDAVKTLAAAEPRTKDEAEPEMETAPPSPGVPAAILDRLMDLELPVSVLLGQTVLPIRDALKITSGSLIELDRQLGDWVEVVIHGTVVARGEIVAIKGNYGVRIKEVISRKDRFALKNAA